MYILGESTCNQIISAFDVSLYVIVRLEAAKDDYRIHCEELEKQLVELQHRNDELTSLAEESRSLKDELDILRLILLHSLLCFFFSSML